MKILDKGFFIFDSAFPMHTWYPVLDGKLIESTPNNNDIYNQIDTSDISKRALYFHIPFCEGNICSFCSFSRKIKTSDEEVDKYVSALIREIEIKSQYEKISQVPIHSIFFGGGTPSILTPVHIRKIGLAIKKHFNLTKLKEFSFENNIHSVTEEKLIALKEIGVTHVRAGVQSLNPKYRSYFDLLTNVDEVYYKLDIMKKYFENVCIDMIYGINGQTIEEFIEDIHLACSIGTKLIDFYPLTQPTSNMKLGKLFTEQGLEPKSELEIMGFGIILKEILKSYGYIAHNGHGFVKVSDSYAQSSSVTSQDYCFEYHKCTMGYDDGDVVGFGAGASSKFINYGMCNIRNISQYISSLDDNIILSDIYEVNPELHYSKGITTHLPYFGYAEKNKLDFSKMSAEVIDCLETLLSKGIIYEDINKYYIRPDAWYWDNVLMYYLSPDCEKNILDSFIKNSENTSDYTFNRLSCLGDENV